MIACDTSTMAKLYVPERESAAVRTRLEVEDEVCVSDLARVELMAVFHRRLREGRWSDADFNVANRQFAADDLAGFWTWLPLDLEVIKSAAQSFLTLPDHLFLRSADCLHLVSAHRHGFEEFYTHDKGQAGAAVAWGLRAVLIEA